MGSNLGLTYFPNADKGILRSHPQDQAIRMKLDGRVAFLYRWIRHLHTERVVRRVPKL